jgi:Endonuclease/Exonuclease/phosphatase family
MCAVKPVYLFFRNFSSTTWVSGEDCEKRYEERPTPVPSTDGDARLFAKRTLPCVHRSGTLYSLFDFFLFMVAIVEHLLSPATLPARPGPMGVVVPSLSVVSYNVLLPNSHDGWWNYKMYNPPLLDEKDWYISSWDYRKDLLKNRIQSINADVVCFQEIAPESFDEDFSFMRDLGYDGSELYKKGRFRPATFWKTSHCVLAAAGSSPAVAAAAVHKDRSLLTAFQLVGDFANDPRHWFVANVHLQAGKNGPRRLRQINEAIAGIMTLARKLKEPSPEQNVRLIVCGDMNGGQECGAVQFLEQGFVDETFLEDNEKVTSSRKELPLAKPMIDVTACVERPEGGVSPPTMVVAELMSSMMEEATYDKPVLSQDMLQRLDRIYRRIASGHGGVMTRDDVEEWLVKINHELGRGDEFRNAALEMGWNDPNPEDPWEVRKKRIELPKEGILTLEGFQNVYRKELDAGKFWGIAHDMAVLGDPMPDKGLFAARYDRMYCSAALQPIAVLDTVAYAPCPNRDEPSDHLPVAASFLPVQ